MGQSAVPRTSNLSPRYRYHSMTSLMLQHIILIPGWLLIYSHFCRKQLASLPVQRGAVQLAAFLLPYNSLKYLEAVHGYTSANKIGLSHGSPVNDVPPWYITKVSFKYHE